MSPRQIHVEPAPPPSGDVRPATGPGWTTIACETFEGAWPTGGWTTADFHPEFAGDVCWGTDDFQPYQSNRSAWHGKGCTDGEDPNDVFYGLNVNSWMIYGPFSLADAAAAEVHFRLWYQTDGQIVGGQVQGDNISVLAFTPSSGVGGYAWAGESTTTTPPTTQGWESITFNLASVPSVGNLLGQPEVYVAWRFLSNDAGTDDGAFVDDVLIHKLVAAAPTRTVTPTPTLARVGGRDFTLDAAAAPVLRWAAGTDPVGYIVLRWSEQSGFAFLPRNLQPILSPPSYMDTDSLLDPAYCYVLLIVGGNPPNINNVLGLGDLLCFYSAPAQGSAPAHFRVHLNGQTALLEWEAAGSPSGYRLTIHRFDGSADQPVPLGADQLSYADPTGGKSSCYILEALVGGNAVGKTQQICAVPGVGAVPNAGGVAGPGLNQAFQRLEGALRGR